VPQADTVEKIVGMVRHVAGQLEELDLSPRHVNYYLHAARVLGFVDDDGELTEAGHALAHTASEDEELAFVLVAFERCEIGSAWLRWAGVERVGELDPGSAGAFLTEASALSPSTAKRRGGTLRAWARRLGPVERQVPLALDGEEAAGAVRAAKGAVSFLERVRRYYAGEDVAPHVARFLGESVDQRVPTRMANWAARNGVETFGDLIAHSRQQLLDARNVGKRTVRQTAGVIERATGMTWEHLRELRGLEKTGGSDTTPPGPPSWDRLRLEVPAALRSVPLEQVPLPKRLLTFVVEPRGYRVLGELIDCDAAELRRIPKLGKRSLKDGAAAIRELVEERMAHVSESAERAAEPPAPTLDDLPDFISHVLGRVARLEPLDRLVFARRAGFHGEAPTLSHLGETIGVSRERVRQLEKRAADRLAQEWWAAPARERVTAALEQDVVPLERLAEDELFSEVVEHAEAFDYLLKRVLRSGLRVVTVGEERLVARTRQRDVDRAMSATRRRVRQLDFPVPLEEALKLAREEAAALCAGLVPPFERELLDELMVVEGDDGPTATGLGDGTAARVLAFLEAQDGPVRKEVVEEAIGRRLVLPEAAIYVARGVVALPKHVPDFDLWTARLTPLCVAIMRADGPGRQWSVTELLDEVAEQAQLPEWLGHWHLASMLRLGGRVRYLGRLQVALDHEEAPEERLHVRDVLRETLLEVGEPMPLGPLLEALFATRGGSETAAQMTLLGAPFLQVDAERYGLVERDLPGGPEALAEAANALEAELEARQEGLGVGEVLALVRELSPEHERWTLEMAKSVPRLHDAFRLNRSGGIGLADWDDERLPTRRDLVKSLVEEAGGRVAVASVMDAVEATFGRRPSRLHVSNLASPFGHRLRGDELVSEALLVEAGPDPTLDGVDPADLAGLPAAAVAVFRELLREPRADFAALRAEARDYVTVFEEARASGGLVDPQEARRVAEAAVRLLDRVGDGDGEDARLVQAAVRYFVRSDDAENDFVVGGLDDDIAVLDAVARHLGHPDCVVKLGDEDEAHAAWMHALPEGPVRQLFAHLALHGCVTEPEAVGMLGSPRALRRFARRFERLTEQLPFQVRIEMIRGVKRYVLEGTRT
jgi:hypothetical protein